MDMKKMLTGSVVGALVLFAVGFLFWEVLFREWFEGQMLVEMREAPVVWAMFAAALAHGLLLTLVVDWKGDLSVAGGFKTAGLVGLLFWLGTDLTFYGAFEFATLASGAVDTVLSALQNGIAGAAIAAVIGRSAASGGEATG